MTEKALSIFGGVRGWDLYDAELGIWSTSVDNDPAATATALANPLGTAPATAMDVRNLNPNCYSHNPNTILKCSPPCGEFTVAGNGEGREILNDLVNCVPLVTAKGGKGVFRMRLINADAALVLEPMRLIRLAHEAGQPYRAIVMEQTKEVLPVWHAYAEVLQSLGYSVAVGILHAEQYGVPQSRTRAVLIARRDGVAKLPTPTHGRYHTMTPQRLDEGLVPWVPMGQVLTDLVPDRETYLRSNYGTGGDASKRGIRDLWQPAPTITRKYNRNKWVVSGEVIRGMSDTEAAMLQTFPKDYVWRGKKTEIQLQIGNAIPPLLAKAILEQVL